VHERGPVGWTTTIVLPRLFIGKVSAELLALRKRWPLSELHIESRVGEEDTVDAAFTCHHEHYAAMRADILATLERLGVYVERGEIEERGPEERGPCSLWR